MKKLTILTATLAVWALLCFVSGSIFKATVVERTGMISGVIAHVRLALLIPRSGAYQSISFKAKGLIPPGRDLATSSEVYVTITKNDAKQKTLHVNMVDYDKRLGEIRRDNTVWTLMSTNPDDPQVYIEWMRSIGLDTTHPQVRSEAFALSKLVPGVGLGPKGGFNPSQINFIQHAVVSEVGSHVLEVSRLLAITPIFFSSILGVVGTAIILTVSKNRALSRI